MAAVQPGGQMLYNHHHTGLLELFLVTHELDQPLLIRLAPLQLQ